MDAFTPRNVAKFLVQATVLWKTAKFAENVITDHTRFEKDNMIVDHSTYLIGWYTSNKLQPYTNKMVDKTADWLVARKEQKTQKETTE